ncbi:hypothetical protein M0813_12132 [Anaeramoeba flamelloides]|uniref:Uncharacterized protein n=1 Tax=Anaeramoeba flamelloides TaxID=1746091 RepID=A0ABQ8ZCX8_9EUKA|nr:hypothetical protein M0813_12132 [Anaeramoeba flamelloides]
MNINQEENSNAESTTIVITPLSPWDVDPFDIDEVLDKLEKEKASDPDRQIEDLKERLGELEEEKLQLNLFIKKILSENKRLKKKLRKSVVY